MDVLFPDTSVLSVRHRSCSLAVRRRLMLAAFVLPLFLASWCWSQSTTRPAAIANPSVASVEPAVSARVATEEKVAGRNDATPIRRSNEQVSPSSSAAPRIGPGAVGQGISATRVAVALGIVLLLIFGLRWAARGIFPGAGIARSNRAVQVLSRTVISPKQQLMLVQVGRRVIVVADSGAQMNPLCEITDADEIAALLGQVQTEKSEPIGRSFRTLFGGAEQKFGANFASSNSGAENSVARARAPVHDGAPDDDDGDPALGTTQEELSGLMEKVRLLSKQFRRTS